MHIIATVREPSNQLGGIEKSLLDVLWGLYDRGHEITLVYCQEGDQLPTYQQFCTHTIQVNTFRVNPLLWLDASKIPVLKDSLVYCNEYADLFFSFVIATLKHIPLVSHDRLPAPVERNLLRRWKQAVTLAHVNRHIVVSNAVKQDWITIAGLEPKQMDLVYNGIDTNYFRPALHPSALKEQLHLDETTRVVSYIGRLETYKGLDSLIRGFCRLLESHPQTQLLIAGRSVVCGESYEQHLRSLVAQLGIAKQVTFTGHLSNPRDLYQTSDVVVVPSLWLEGFGRVVVESMACGTPVVASRVGGIQEIMTQEFEAYLFEPGDECSLVKILERVLYWRSTDPDLSQRCRNHAVQQFGKERMVTEVETVLLQTLAQG